MMLVQLFMAAIINPKTLNFSRSLLKNSELQFIPSLLKVRQFNDTVKGLTIFVENKKIDGTYENIFIKDEGKVLTQISGGSSTIFAKSGYATKNGKNLILFNGNIQKLDTDGNVNIITFNKTIINLSGLSTKTISEPKIQETSTIQIFKCMQKKNKETHNCSRHAKNLRDTKAEINRRFGMPIFIPLVSLVSCFLLRTRREEKIVGMQKYICFFIGFLILMASEITVRYSGISLKHTAAYYLLPIVLLPLVYFLLLKTFKYENLS